MENKTALIDYVPPVTQPDDDLEVEITAGDFCMHYFSPAEHCLMVRVPAIGRWLLRPEGATARA